MTKADFKRFYKGFRIEEKWIIDNCLLYYRLSDIYEHVISLKFPIPDETYNSERDEKYIKVYNTMIPLLDSLPHW